MGSREDYYHHQHQRRPFVTFYVNHINPGSAEQCRPLFTLCEKGFRKDPEVVCFQWHMPFDVSVTSPESLTRIPLMVRTEWESTLTHDNFVFGQPLVADAATRVDPFLEAHFLSIWEKIYPVNGVKYDSRRVVNADRVVSVTHRTCKVECRDEFRKIIIRLAERCCKHCAGNIMFDVNISLDPDVPNNFSEYCVWDSLDDYDTHFDDPIVQDMLSQLCDLQVEPSQTRLWKFFTFCDMETETGEFRPLHHK